MIWSRTLSRLPRMKPRTNNGASLSSAACISTVTTRTITLTTIENHISFLPLHVSTLASRLADVGKGLVNYMSKNRVLDQKSSTKPLSTERKDDHRTSRLYPPGAVPQKYSFERLRNQSPNSIFSAHYNELHERSSSSILPANRIYANNYHAPLHYMWFNKETTSSGGIQIKPTEYENSHRDSSAGEDIDPRFAAQSALWIRSNPQTA